MKTINQAAKEYAIKSDLTQAGQTKRQCAFEAGAKFAQQWISVKDALPEECISVLVKTMNGKRIQYDVDYMLNGKFKQRTNVTHWRYIELE